jgi:hypothetical protein
VFQVLNRSDNVKGAKVNALFDMDKLEVLHVARELKEALPVDEHEHLTNLVILEKDLRLRIHDHWFEADR